MSDRGTFPWRPALAACALLCLALLTISIRAQAVQEGEALMQREHVRLSLRRHAHDLSLQLQQASHQLGSRDRAATEGEVKKKGTARS
ncbi:MAG TPA: hypothetical protein VFY71_00585 [Planctomycetota bacterium]|nr:hypothetical protein [Planctomycetota bacterium]